ncbi:MAG TPA: response regulator transcription factor [Candidatus Saccharimonadales bacterium]|nr:response regulator transcription factor [Candidatus Saccharimonadales bacterium]
MMRVLIVDDHEIVRRGLREILSDEFSPLEVGEAGHFSAALEQILRQSWDLIIVDINLPGRSGLEVLEEAKRLRAKTPVLMLSAYPEEEFAVRSFKLGASGYLNKSFAADELRVAAKKVIAGGKYVTAALAEKLAATLGPDVQAEAHETLSTREIQVLRMVAQGRTIKEIAAELALSEKTVATYRTRISQKMGLGSNVELTRYALRHGLVD